MKYYKLDKDVKQYLKRMALDGIKTPADIYSVNDFIVGLKDLNLWNLVYEGWFLRKNQNAGSGSKIYGIKNILNGTLVNGSWGEAGMIFTLSTGYINIGEINITNIKRFSTFAILNTLSNNDNSYICGLNSHLPTNPTGSVYLHAIYGPTGNRVLRESDLSSGNLIRDWGNTNNTNVGIGFYYASSGRDDLQSPTTSEGFTEHNSSRNTNKTGTGILPRTFTGSSSIIFSSQNNSIRNEICVFQMWFLDMLDINQTTNLRALSKATIGRGLVLP